MIQDRYRVRVWNKETKEMIYNAEYAYDGMNYNSEYQIYKNNNDGHICCLGEYLDDSKTYEPMQCTGLKDKKGELVYFNDFIKLDDGIVCIVKQIEDINDIEYGRVVAIPVFCFVKKYQTQYIPTVIAEGEKIGNFYENPELLDCEVE